MTTKTDLALATLLRHATRASASHKALATATATEEVNYQAEAERLGQELDRAIDLNHYKDMLIAAASWGESTIDGGIAAMRKRLFTALTEDPRNVHAFGAAFREQLSDAEAYMFATVYAEWCQAHPAWKLPDCYLGDVNNMVYVSAQIRVNAWADALDEVRAEREAGSAAGQEQQVAGDDASEENQGD